MELTKLKNRAKIISIICLVISIGFFGFCAISIFKISLDSNLAVAALVSSLLLCLLSLYIMVSAFRMMHGVMKEDSPFTLGNVNLLRGIGWALIVFEAAQELSAQILSRMAFSQLAIGEEIMVVSSMGGLFFIVGVMLLGVSMIFRYGIELQRQSDETL